MLKIGDVVATRNVRAYFTNTQAKGYAEYKAEKAKNMVFLYLGQEPKNGSQNINPDKRLRELGWEMQKA